MLSDGSLVTSILLVDCLLDDIRKHRASSGIKRLMERKEIGVATRRTSYIASSETVSRSMLDVTYQQKDTDTFRELC